MGTMTLNRDVYVGVYTTEEDINPTAVVFDSFEEAQLCVLDAIGGEPAVNATTNDLWQGYSASGRLLGFVTKATNKLVINTVIAPPAQAQPT